MKIQSIREVNKLKGEGEKLLFSGSIRIQVGAARCGLARGAKEVITAFEKELKNQKLDATVISVGCIGMCYEEPLVEMLMPGKPKLTYGRITPELVSSLVKSLAKGKPLKKNLLYRTNAETLIINGKTVSYAAKTPSELKTTPAGEDLTFFNTQLRITMRNAGLITH